MAAELNATDELMIVSNDDVINHQEAVTMTTNFL